ncbi:MAG: hypothetical protein WC980_00170 [Candidatus Brocadiia bacterium]
MKKALWLALLLTPVIIMGSCGEKSRKAAELAKQGWGAESEGLVAILTGPDSIEVDGALAVDLSVKNINSEPVTISDNDMINFTIIDQNKQPVQWTRTGSSMSMSRVVTLKPDEAYSMSCRMDANGTFVPALKPGMKLSITASYDEPTTKAKLSTKPLSVFIRDNSWGATVNGLRCYLRNVPETINVSSPLYFDVVIENTDLQKPVVLRSSPDNKEKPQIDIEITGNGNKTLFKSKRGSNDPYGFCSLPPGAKVYVSVVPCTKEEAAQLRQVNFEQRAIATDKNMKLAYAPNGAYAVTASYSHLVEKGKKYPKDWKNGWTGTVKSNLVAASFTGSVAPPPPPAPPVIEIKPAKGKVKTVKSSKDAAAIQKSLASLKPLKKPSKSNVLGTVTVTDSGAGSAVYQYSSAYLLSDGTQYQIPETLKKYLPKQ